MDMVIGPIFKLIRCEKDIKQKVICEKLGLSLSKLSDFENGKRDLPKEEIDKLCKNLDLHYDLEIGLKGKAEEYLKEIFQSICERKVEKEEILIEVKKYIYDAHVDESYITFLLCDFLYNVYHPNSFYSYDTFYSIIHEYERYLTPYAKQLFYDTAGVHFKNNEKFDQAFYYLDLSIQCHVSDLVLAMSFYHKAMLLVLQGKLLEAREISLSAMNIFAQELCIMRVLMVKIVFGMVNTRLYRYEEAEKIYSNLLPLVKSEFKTQNVSNDIKVYNNLIWNYLLWGKYDKVIEYSDIALTIDPTFSNFYVYKAYVYYKLDDNVECRKQVKNALYHEEKAYKFEKSFMKVLSSISTNRPFSSQAKRLQEAYDIAMKLNDIQLQVFILETASEVCHKHNELEKELDYKNKIIYLLKQSH